MTQVATAQKRAMFVWLPNFLMTLARLKKPPLARPGEPLVLIEKCGNIRRIAALDGPAMRAGLYLNQALADALAVYPKLIAADAEPGMCEKALVALAFWAQRYSPLTAPLPNIGLWLDITGCAHLWGGEGKLAEDLLGRLEAWRIPARAAIAPTFGAAYALAHHAERYVIATADDLDSPSPQPSPAQARLGELATSKFPHSRANADGEGAGRARLNGVPSFAEQEWVHYPLPLRERVAAKRPGEGAKLAALLAPLPVERLRIGEETAALLRKLGLFTIGEVQKLPRAGLSRRFPDLPPQLDKALGLTQEAIEFMRPPIPWIERLRFAEPISAPEDLERVTAKLLEMLCARLEAGRQGGLKFELSFFRSDGGVETQAVSAALPTRDAARIMRLFREKLGLIDPGFGIDLAMLSAPNTEPLDERQSSILKSGDNAACIEELAALIDALENRLGKGRVFRLVPQESYIPERAVKQISPLPSPCPSPMQVRLGELATSECPHPQADADRRGSGPCPSLQQRSLSQRERDRVRGDESVWQRLGERPVRLFARPQPIDVTAALPDSPPSLFRWRKVLHRIARAEGPERISPEWWREGDADDESQTRDYYRVESTAGLRFWVFREGAYGGEKLPRWYLHGLFP